MTNTKGKSLLIYLTVISAISSILINNTYAQGTEMLFANPDDIDGDSIPNDWELNGIDVNNDNVIDLDLSSLGASPYHKDLFLEIDYMKSHKPYTSVVPDVVT